MRSRSATGRAALPAAGWAAVVLAAAGWAGAARGQGPAVPAFPAVTPGKFDQQPGSGGGVAPIGCTSCGALPPVGPLGAVGAGCGAGDCGEAGCVPGRPPCDTCDGCNRFTRLFCAFHNALCCPDPCYEPRWVPAANAALFVPSVRPATYTRLRWDYGNNLTTPDRAEFFWAAIGAKGPPNAERRVNYHELSLYVETGTPNFSFFIDTPYRNVRALDNGGSGSFGDLSIGTKSALVDSELLLTVFQFKSTFPTGNPRGGTGVGHVSLEPSLLYAVKAGPDAYWQGQLAYWIPLSPSRVGGSNFSGGVFQFHNALNCVLWRPVRDTMLIGTLEGTGYTFTAGQVTVPPGPPLVRRSAQTTYFHAGPGLRLSVCDRLDVGFGMQFALTSEHLADQLYRTELRWRF